MGFMGISNLWLMLMWTIHLLQCYVEVFINTIIGTQMKLASNSCFEEESKNSLRTCIVTGATSGIGRAAAEYLYMQGYHVVLGCRSVQTGNLVAEELRSISGKGFVEVLELDLCSPASIETFVLNIYSSIYNGNVDRPFSLLVNNAALFCGRYSVTQEGLERTMAANYVGHFLLTCRLLPLLQKSAPNARIVNIVSFTHRAVSETSIKKYLNGGQDAWSDFFKGSLLETPAQRYQLSKLCLLLFSYELHNRYWVEATSSLKRISCISVDPGLVDSNLLREMPRWIYKIARTVFFALHLMDSPSDAAQAVLRAALSPREMSGVYCFSSRSWILPSSIMSRRKDVAAALWKSTVDALRRTGSEI